MNFLRSVLKTPPSLFLLLWMFGFVELMLKLLLNFMPLLCSWNHDWCKYMQVYMYIMYNGAFIVLPVVPNFNIPLVQLDDNVSSCTNKHWTVLAYTCYWFYQCYHLEFNGNVYNIDYSFINMSKIKHFFAVRTMQQQRFHHILHPLVIVRGIIAFPYFRNAIQKTILKKKQKKQVTYLIIRQNHQWHFGSSIPGAYITNFYIFLYIY